MDGTVGTRRVLLGMADASVGTRRGLESLVKLNSTTAWLSSKLRSVTVGLRGLSLISDSFNVRKLSVAVQTSVTTNYKINRIPAAPLNGSTDNSTQLDEITAIMSNTQAFSAAILTQTIEAIK